MYLAVQNSDGIVCGRVFQFEFDGGMTVIESNEYSIGVTCAVKQDERVVDVAFVERNREEIG